MRKHTCFLIVSQTENYVLELIDFNSTLNAVSKRFKLLFAVVVLFMRELKTLRL